MLEIEIHEVIWYVDHALDQMVAILRALGDEKVNERPGLPGANTPFAIVTHCLGVMNGWGGLISGRAVNRDREAEFVAQGRVDELIAALDAARTGFAADLATLDPLAAPRGEVRPDFADEPSGRTQGGIVPHVFEELYQHLGQLKLTRDVLVAQATG